jgi:pimeloyl-ACP methyl ester carboxylesterase
VTILRRDTAVLSYEVTGSGEPLVLVHGGWNDRTRWNRLVPLLADSVQVLTYDRRGHGDSTGSGPMDLDVDDLAAIVDIAGTPAHIVGNSFGALITLRLAARSPQLVRTVTVHEPPVYGLLPGHPDAERSEANTAKILALLREGRHTEGAQLFIDTVALGPGSWDRMPETDQSRLIRHAPTFLEEAEDRSNFDLDPAPLRRLGDRIVLTRGTHSPPHLHALTGALAIALPEARLHDIEGAGHIPHLTHPDLYADVIRRHVTGDSPDSRR